MQDLEFENFVNIMMNFAMDAFHRSADVDEGYLTIYKIESVGSLSERLVSIGECCVDCSCKTVQGCIIQCGLYVIAEKYVVQEVSGKVFTTSFREAAFPICQSPFPVPGNPKIC